MAHLARDVHIRQEVHLDLYDSVAGAGLAPPALDVEAEAALRVAARLRVRRRREDASDHIEHTRVGRGVGARRAADRRLIDRNHLVEPLDPLHAPEGAGDFVRAV